MENLTEYQAKIFAYELTRQQPSNDVAKFTSSLQDAKVDMNPHEVGAALFGFISSIDPYIFGDLKSIKSPHNRLIETNRFDELKKRLRLITNPLHGRRSSTSYGMYCPAT